MEEFLEIFNTYIKREGADKLLDFLKASDFFEAPSSTKFHSAYAGGLVDHSLNVYKRLKHIIKEEYGEEYARIYSDETIAICALLHDVCKANYYETYFRNVKDENGQWVQKQCYKVNDSLPYGHGEKSVYIINGFIRLTREEAMAINWHMGGFDCRVKGGSYGMSEAYDKFPLCVFLQVADLMASYVDEQR